jgi:hypothetical protein
VAPFQLHIWAADRVNPEFWRFSIGVERPIGRIASRSPRG